jgi:hypothetical protein
MVDASGRVRDGEQPVGVGCDRRGGWAEETRGRNRDGVYKQERQRRTLRVRLLARDGAKVCTSGMSSVWEWHSVENNIARATSRAVHLAGVKRVRRRALVLETAAGAAGCSLG